MFLSSSLKEALVSNAYKPFSEIALPDLIVPIVIRAACRHTVVAALHHPTRENANA
jgi:hypothetical protein